jgi:hypothetical protein
VDGLLNLDEFAEQTGLELPEGPYETAAGYVLAALGALPSAGDTVQVGGRTITVTELDGRRIARLRVTANVPPPSGPVQPAPAPAAPPPAAPGAPPPAAPAGSASTSGTSANGVSPGQVRLDSEAPRE